MKSKSILVTILAAGFACAALAIDKPHAEQNAQRIVAKFQSMQQKPERRVPAEMLAKAKGVILLDRTKAGFIFAYQGGSGLMLVKDKKGNWSAPAFMSANEGSIGFQIGGQQTFFVILLMNEQSVKSMLDGASIEVGGEARGTAGEVSSGAEGTVQETEKSMLVYDDRKGLYGGAAVKLGGLSADSESNLVYYGEPVTMSEILFEGKVKTSATGLKLAQRLTDYSKPPSK